jgi:hypothetical protein
MASLSATTERVHGASNVADGKSFLPYRNVHIGVIVLVLIFHLFHDPAGSQHSAFRSMTLSQLLMMDPVGSIVTISAVVCVLLAFQFGGSSKGWSSPTVVGLVVIFPVIFGLFFLFSRSKVRKIRCHFGY